MKFELALALELEFLTFATMEEAQIDVFNFDPIRPYNDEELKAAIERILEVPEFYKMLKWVFICFTLLSVKSFSQ